METQTSQFNRTLLLFVLPILLVAGLFYADWQWMKPQQPA